MKKLVYLEVPEIAQTLCRESSGSVVEYLTRDRGAAGSSLTGVPAFSTLLEQDTFILA